MDPIVTRAREFYGRGLPLVDALAPEPLPRSTDVEGAHAFVAEINGKTILTAPVAAREIAATNPAFLLISGKFVGAEKANRNGALWTTGDLEMGQPTVTHGPLNWLHEERHIVGALASSRMVTQEAASDLGSDPHIAVDSVVWKWIYPQEAATIQLASDQGSLWYSMECIAENVHCGDCSGSYPYMDVMRASAEVCEHVTGRTATRRMENPTFLGGAIIVPPVRPGWADANVEVMRQGASFAEKAWDQSQLPDGAMAAGDWERLMANVVRFAA
jgi:hypothetical protein